MRIALPTLAGAGFALALFATTPRALAVEGSPAPPEVAEAHAAAAQLLRDTRALLASALREQGAAGALTTCASAAQGLAAARAGDGWTVRRISLKVRNPANAPDAWEREQLRRLEASHRRSTLPADAEVWSLQVRGDRRTLRYLKPIVLAAEPCLQCHGPRAALAAGVREALRERYPRDRAVGYRAGELRGAVSITVPIAAP